MIPTHLLDNPAWAALTTIQASFAQGTREAKRYQPGVLPFVGLMPSCPATDLDPFLTAGESFYIIGALPELPPHWTLEFELPCEQLIAPEDPDLLPPIDEEIVPLGEANAVAMFELINSVQPGYYLPDTRLVGDYFGIFQDGRLIAMAGERMRMTGLSEISAVCTAPAHTGKGYAQQLMAHLCRRQRAAGITPFLHVAKANQRALRLYAYLGFHPRRDISFWKVRKEGPGE